jgi:predicted metal-dependent phosphoesterase TrpH
MCVPIPRMWRPLRWITILTALSASSAYGQERALVFTGEVPLGDETHFFVPFEVPEGIVEIEVRHDDLSSVNILDWGLDDPDGFRGWGGGNSEAAIVGEQWASRSYVPGPMPAGTWEVAVGKARIDELPAMYRIEIFLRTEATLRPQPRMPYQDPGVLDDEARWYAGDFHVHTRQSGDADPTIGEAVALARAVGLDFVVLTEHNTNSGLTLYGSVQPDYPDVLIVPGVEWTTYAGHANAFGATEWVDHKIGVRGVTTEGAIQSYHEQGALFSINHPTVPGGNFCIGCPWEIAVDPETVDGVEVQSAIWEAVDYWEQMINDGSRAPAIGGSDDHSGGQGSGVLYTPLGVPTTMVFAESLSVAAILDAIRDGRTVVRVDGVDGPMLETELTGERMGDTVFADASDLTAVVTGGVGRTLLVIKNGSVTDRVPIDSDLFTHTAAMSGCALGRSRLSTPASPTAACQMVVPIPPARAAVTATSPPRPDPTPCCCYSSRARSAIGGVRGGEARDGAASAHRARALRAFP